MPIVESDILFKLSVTTGTSGNSTAQSDVNASLGKYISLTEITSGVLNNLFDDVTGDENEEGDVEYRCVFVHNSHGSLTYKNAKLWISGEVSGGATTAIGVDPTAASLIGSSTAQAVTIADEDSPPSGVTFTSPVVKISGVALGNISGGYCRAFWVQRTAHDTTAVNSDGVTLTIAGDSGA